MGHKEADVVCVQIHPVLAAWTTGSLFGGKAALREMPNLRGSVRTGEPIKNGIFPGPETQNQVSAWLGGW